MTVFDVFASSKSSSPKETGEDGKIDCRVGFECQAGANDRAGGRNSESDDSSNERLTPPLAFVESPIKKMLLKELIEAHEKEREDNDESAFGNLEKVDSSKKKKSPKKKKTNGFAENTHELDDEEDDATLRSMSSTEQCFESTALYHNFSEPIPIPVADVRLRCVFRRAFQSAFPLLFPFPSSLSFF